MPSQYQVCNFAVGEKLLPSTRKERAIGEIFAILRLRFAASFVSIVYAMKTDNLTFSFLALRDKLHRSAMAFLKNDEDAKDALQDVFFNLWKHGGIESEPEARNKMFAVLRNICIDRLRKPQTLGIDNISAEMLKVEPVQFEDIEKYESLLTTGLTDIQRQIYTLVTHKGMEYDTIAESMNMSIDAVRMNMSRARKKIHDNYKQLEK